MRYRPVSSGAAQDGAGSLHAVAAGSRSGAVAIATFRSQSNTGSGRKLRGHYAYYGITGNHPALSRFYRATERVWRQWLDRRSRKAQVSWERFWRIKQRYPLPEPRVVHSVDRLAANF